MTYIIPTRLTTPNPTLSFVSTSLTTSDDCERYLLSFTFSSNTSNGKLVRLAINAGTATYFDGSIAKAADWMIEGATLESGGTVVQIPVQGGIQTFDLTVRVNENMHTQETQIATILAGSGYVPAASNITHTATVNASFDRPVAGNTGPTGTLQTYTGSAKLTGGVYSDLLFTGGSYKIQHSGIEFYNCHFKPTGLGDANGGTPYIIFATTGFSGGTFVDCEFGNDNQIGNTSYSAHFLWNYVDEPHVNFTGCHFHSAGWDHFKLVGRGWRFSKCFFEIVGTAVPWWTGSDQAPHGDILQTQDGWVVEDVEIDRCNMYLPISVGDGLGASYNSAWQLDGNGTVLRSVRIRSSWLIGSNKTLSGKSLDKATIDGFTVENCRFGTRFGTDYRQQIVNDGSGQIVIRGGVSDHDDDMTPTENSGSPVNNAKAF